MPPGAAPGRLPEPASAGVCARLAGRRRLRRRRSVAGRSRPRARCRAGSARCRQTLRPGASPRPRPIAPSPMFNPANVGISPGPASGGLNAAGFQGIAPPSMMPADFPHHVEAGLMPPGAGGIPPTPPIAPQVAPTPVSPTTAPTAGSGDWHSAIPAEQPSAPQASSPSYSSPAASSSTSTSSPTNAGYMSSTTAPSTSYTGGALPTYGSDLRPPAASVPAGSPSLPPPARPTRHPHQAHHRPTPQLAPAAESAQQGRRVRSSAPRRPSSRHPWALQAKRLRPARLELWQARLRQTQRHESDCSASSMRWPDRSRGLHGLPAIALTIRPS